MSMSGIEVVEDVTILFNDMKLRSTHKWAMFNITDDKKRIEMTEAGDPCPTESFEDDKAQFDIIKEKIEVGNPTYILYDFGFTNKEGRIIKKLAFIYWCDDNAPIKKKMLYASSKDTIKKAFTGLGIEFQANDKGDFDYDVFSKEVEKKA